MTTIRTYPELSPEQIAERNIIEELKQGIKDDAVRIRSRKREIRESMRTSGSGSAALEQMRLSAYRVENRARLLVYGVLRGRTWDQIENKHDEKISRLRYYIALVWKQTGSTVEMPNALKAIG